MDLKEDIQILFEQLGNFFKTETVVGKPIVVGEITLIPVVNVTFGAGNGGGNKNASGNDGSGGIGGAGGKIEPNAIIVIKGDEVNVLPLNGKAPMDTIFDMIPEIITKIKQDKKD